MRLRFFSPVLPYATFVLTPNPRELKGIEMDSIPYKSKSSPDPFKSLSLKINEQGLTRSNLHHQFQQKVTTQKSWTSEL
jgi:hypothetical protein